MSLCAFSQRRRIWRLSSTRCAKPACLNGRSALPPTNSDRLKGPRSAPRPWPHLARPARARQPTSHHADRARWQGRLPLDDAMLTETVYVDGDLLCEQSENMFGRPDCGPVYRRNGAAGKGYYLMSIQARCFTSRGRIGAPSGVIDRVQSADQLPTWPRPSASWHRPSAQHRWHCVGESVRVAFVVDQVELAVDDLECFRIDIDRNRSAAATSPAQYPPY